MCFLPVVNSSLHAMFRKICTNGNDSLFHSVSSPTTSLCTHPLLGLCKYSARVDECQWVPLFLHRVQFHCFASYALPCQMPFCQTAPLLPSVTWQQNGTECWLEGSTSAAIPPTSTSVVMGQHNKIGGITFRAALVLCYQRS